MPRTPIPYRVHSPVSVEDLANQLNMLMSQIDTRLRDVEDVSDAPASNSNYVEVLATSSAQVVHTGNTIETILATIPIPAAAMGATGALKITILGSFGSPINSNVKRFRVRFGSSGAGLNGTQLGTVNGASNLSMRGQIQIQNRSAKSQISFPVVSGFTVSTSAIDTAAINTRNASEIVITGTLADGTDTIRLEAYLVELIR